MNYRIVFFLLCSACFSGNASFAYEAKNGNSPVFAKRRQVETPRIRKVLDTYYPQVKNGDSLWISADAVFWIPSEDAIVLTNRKTDLFTVNNVTLQPTLHTKFNWDFGSRVGFGYLFKGPSENWDMALYWTYYPTHTSKKSNTRGDISEGMFPIWSLSSDIIPYDWVANAKMSWTLDLNILDLDFGRSYSFRWFHIRPYTGLRSVWIDQDFNVNYGGGIFANGPDLYAMSNNAGFDQIYMQNDYWGIGPILGVSPQFDLGKGFRIYANAGGSFTLGYFHLVQNEVYLMNTRFLRRTNPFGARWILDVAGGVSWETFIVSERYALTFNLGWEYHLFFHQFELQRDQFGLVPDDKNLELTGGIFSARFNF